MPRGGGGGGEGGSKLSKNYPVVKTNATWLSKPSCETYIDPYTYM